MVRISGATRARPRGGCGWRVAVVLAVWSAAPAAAQPVVLGESPTQGLSIPAGRLVGDVDATMVKLNPAGLPLTRGGSLVYVHTELDRDGARGVAGDGFYLSTPPLFARLAYGLSLELMRPPHAFRPGGSVQKLGFGFGFKLLPGTAVGLTWNHLFSSAATGDRGVDSFDLGVTVRPISHLGAAYVLRDLNRPAFDVLGTRRAVDRIHECGLVLRPLGDDRVEVAGGIRLRSWEHGDPSVRASVRLLRGVHLEGDFAAPELRTRDLQTGVEELRRDFRGSAGLRVDLDHASVALFALLGQGRLGGGRYQGVAGLVKLSSERQTPLWHGPAEVRRVTIKGGDSDRDFAALLLELRDAERDPSVAAVLLLYEGLDVGWGRTEEIRAAIARLRSRGKRVFAYADDLAMRSYYLLCGAEKLWVNPAAGQIQLSGLAGRLTFFKGSLEKLGVQADFVKIAEFKSAPERYTRAESSGPARQQREAMFDDIFGRLVGSMARDRQLTPDSFRKLVDAGPYTPSEAALHKLIDGLKYRDELKELLVEVLGRPVRLRDLDEAPWRYPSWQPPRVAVVFVDGDIVDGKSREVPFLDTRLAGGDTIAEAIRHAGSNAATRAIVLRVNSPGGSVTASDQILREVARLRGKKPIVCSMGDVAASGGYYISALCDRIFAEPSTITGSIGIFTGKLDLSGLMGKLGITAESYVRGAQADLWSPFRLWSPEERAIIMRELRYSYDRFLEHVATGRQLSKTRVDEIGRGHVWTGAQASGLKLVDEVGGLLDAIDFAARRSGLSADERALVWPLPERSRGVLDYLKGLGSESEGATDWRAVLLGRDAAPRRASPTPLPPVLRAPLRAIPPALLYGRAGAALYRMEFDPPRE